MTGQFGTKIKFGLKPDPEGSRSIFLLIDYDNFLKKQIFF